MDGLLTRDPVKSRKDMIFDSVATSHLVVDGVCEYPHGRRCAEKLLAISCKFFTAERPSKQDDYN